LSKQIGLRGPSDKHGPRIHDLRHRFATMTLLRWYRSGKDVERRLPFLSAYLGHVHVSDTYWYLSAWPELMQQANEPSRTVLGGQVMTTNTVSFAPLLERFFTQRLILQR